PAPAGLLLVLDDLHWADRPTLMLLQHLARRLGPTPILVAGSYRTVDLDRAHPLAALLAELHRERLADRITLSALTPADITTLIAGLAGSDPVPEVVAAITRETEGNPFFVEEVVRQLLAEGRNLADAGAVAGGWRIPEGVREVIGARLSRLSPTARHVLRTGAVLGDGFSFDALTAAIEMEAAVRADLLDALEETLTAGVLREATDGYFFSHPLIRQAIYDELRLPHRRRLHLQAALALEGLSSGRSQAHVAAIAMHLRLADAAADPATTIQYARRAAGVAAGVFAWEEAAMHWQTVLDLLLEDDGAGRAEAMLSLGEAQQRAGALAESKVALSHAARLARALEDAELLARAALSYGVGEEMGGAVDEATLSLLEEARTAMGEHDTALRARVLARLSWQQLLPGWVERRRTLSAAAVEAARQVGDPQTLAYALNARHWGLAGPDTLDERLAVATEIIQVASVCGDLEMEMAGHLWRLLGLLERGDRKGAGAEIAAYATLADRVRAPYVAWYAPLFQAMLALLDGRLDEAEEHSRRMIEIGRRGQPILAEVHHQLQMAMIMEHCGRPGAALDHFGPIVAAYPLNPAFHAAGAHWLAAAGEHEQALRHFEEHGGFTEIDRDEDWLALNAWAAAVCTELGDAKRAARLHETLNPYADRFPLAGNAGASLGSMEYYLGLLAATMGRRAQALAHFERAATANERLGARVWLLQTWIEHATLLLAGDEAERGRAAELAEQAIEAATALGLSHLAERATALGRTAHGPPYQSKRRPGPDRLTEREVEVLRLIAAGRTNREIADELVLSIRTVERHVAHIYAKAGARGRADATRYAVRHNLVPNADTE
ncbi:MAG: helix-turn-helix transcriptional regulator, partial [Dehalococcoidia bacterium]